MTVRVVVRKGNNAINSAYAGEVGELTYDSDNQTIRIHDGTTLGGTKTVTTNSNGNLISTINVANITSLTSNTANISTANITSLVSNNITVANEPLSNTQLANKLYVDKKFRLSIALSGV